MRLPMSQRVTRPGFTSTALSVRSRAFRRCRDRALSRDIYCSGARAPAGSASPPGSGSVREFFRQVWDDEYVDDGSLARCIAEVRAALGDDAREPRYVETVPRRGYRLSAAVGDGRVSAPPALPVSRPPRLRSPVRRSGRAGPGRRWVPWLPWQASDCSPVGGTSRAARRPVRPVDLRAAGEGPPGRRAAAGLGRGGEPGLSGRGLTVRSALPDLPDSCEAAEAQPLAG